MNSFIKFIGLALLLGCAGQSTVFASARSLLPVPDGSAGDAVRQKRRCAKFTLEEDERLRALVGTNETPDWTAITAGMPGRTLRQCKERWNHYLSPNVSNSPWTEKEDGILREKHEKLGPKWVQIAKFLQGRTDQAVKNRWFVLQRGDNRAGPPDFDVEELSSEVSFSEALFSEETSSATPFMKESSSEESSSE